jgi:hypothetical protein
VWTADYPPPRWQRIENALWAWRDSERQLREDPNHACRRLLYERAIASVVKALSSLSTMDALLHSYFDDRRALHLCVERVCGRVKSRRPLSRTLVKEAALWRRAGLLLRPPTEAGAS